MYFQLMKEYLEKTAFLQVDHPSTAAFCAAIVSYSSKTETALALYYKVRDHFLYDPFHLDLTPKALQSSTIFEKKRAWCVEKAIILATCARYFDIPSRLGYAIVVNHIGSDKLVHYLKREEIVFHGYTELYLDNRWIKCTPAFDKRICRVSNVSPLDWDGKTDSLFQAYEGKQQFMEYVHDYGSFSDVPIDLMNQEMKKYYPHLFEEIIDTKSFSFIPKKEF